MFYQIFFSPQVKRYVIITYKHDINELPHELQNGFRLTIPASLPPAGLSTHTRKKKDLGF